MVIIIFCHFCPATGKLYGVSSLYVENQERGIDRIIGTFTLSPTIRESAINFYFNPTSHRILCIIDWSKSSFTV